MAVTKKLCECSVRIAWTSYSKAGHVRALGSPLESDRSYSSAMSKELLHLISTNLNQCVSITLREPMLI